ncbi:DNA polymerase III subunit gamma/tau [Geomobilimonas luticola]|uniref:DNA polymerase III subunit gamma/tau n=1 Tax=Geomobilimonas luticola TaxID=1114878 RepID=A0ABS5S9B5_9BACT|nr:DNA polymerase III subunit gamma/tau [Geomobilimonas luticola]MBT0651966.1 DNA polymerase III subunit gamma/tau [Geomobilimonas luticola]
MSYLVLARKWRPQTFRDLIGQEHVSQTLQNAIDSGRIAHAFLFTGARGVGKTSSARILAKALNCEQGTSTEPCNSCSACTEITAGTSVDVFEIDGASNTSVDDIRELRENVKYLPSRCRYKIFIIDEVHMLSTNAFNALLKTLEEPPPHVKFIFATTEPHKLPITILSRCQRFDFKRIPLPKIVDRLRFIVDQEQVGISDGALAMIARKGDGSMRDSLSTLDQVLAFCGEQVGDEDVVALLGVVDRRLLQDAARLIFARDCRGVLDIVRQVDGFGYSMRHFGQELIDQFRTLVILKAVGDAAELAELSAGELAELQELVECVTLGDLQRHLTLLLRADVEMAQSSFPRLVLEMALLKMANLAPVIPVDELLARIQSLEKQGNGVVASGRPTWEAPRSRQAEPPAIRTRPVASSAKPSPAVECEADSPASASAAPQTETPHNGGDWEGFVTFVRGKKPLLAALLEHGRPLRVSAQIVELGYGAGSFQYNKLKDADVLADLTGLAQAYFRGATTLQLKPLSGNVDGLPPTLLEKKSLDQSAREQELKAAAVNHPLVAAALEIFDGVIESVKEGDVSNKV